MFQVCASYSDSLNSLIAAALELQCHSDSRSTDSDGNARPFDLNHPSSQLSLSGSIAVCPFAFDSRHVCFAGLTIDALITAPAAVRRLNIHEALQQVA